MKITTHYTHRGVSLGQKVIYKRDKRKYKIIGLDIKTDGDMFMIIDRYNDNDEDIVSVSPYSNNIIVLKGYENSYYEWVELDEIELTPHHP